MEGKMRKLGMVVILTGILVLVIGSNYSWSQSNKEKPSDVNYVQAWFNEIDVNGDGKISRDEHMKHAEKRAKNRFTRMDVNKDGLISKDEFKEGMPKKRKKGTRKATEQPMGEKKQ
jgi:Ca2+-binding EF-hand superfamily protein